MVKKIVAVLTTVSIFLTLVLSILPFATLTVAAVNTEAALKTALSANQNITLTGNITVTSWTSVAFSGSLNGNGYVISGLKTPLFSTLSGNVQNLGVVTGNSFNGVAVLADKMSAGSVSATFAYGDIHYTGTATAGGLVATLQGGTVTESFSCVNITSTKSAFCGGLIGNITGGTVTACYSSGTIDCKVGKVAGFANQNGGTVSDTYTTCQIKHEYISAKASGVNGVYDNQLSIVRESVENRGVKTNELMTTGLLPTAYYAVTSTAYPTLLAFYDSADTVWTPKARHIIRVSTAAASVEDVDSTQRQEPDTVAFFARMDYLTRETYITKTNINSMAWSIDSANCKMFDAVPATTAVDNGGVGEQAVSTNADLLKSKFVFSANTDDAKLTVTSGGVKRDWYLTSYDKNPYFAGGDGNSSSTYFQITNKTQLDKVRYYSLLGAAVYNVTKAISSIGEFDPIENFIGTFNGTNKVLSDIVLKDNESKCVGFFASTQEDAVIQKVRLRSVTLKNTQSDAVVGALVAKANKAKITEVIVYGDKNALKTSGTCGGLIGEATNTTVQKALVSAAIEGTNQCGGLIGKMVGGSLTLSGSTGYIIGSKNLGGLVGITAKGTSSAKINNCYSTMSIFSSASGTAVKVGGLVGTASSVTLQYSYFAGLVDASEATSGAEPLVGSGTVGNYLYYDSVVMNNSTQATGLITEQMIGTGALSNLSTSNWTKSNGYYPRLAWASSLTLSQVSALPVYYQNYWNEDDANDMTTGWLMKAKDNASFESFTAIDGVDSGSLQVYDVADAGGNVGFGFEAASGVRRIAYKAVDNGIGIRVVAAVRNDLQTLTYTVSGVNNVKTHLEIYFSEDDGQTWRGAQMVVQSGSTTKPLMYDIPKNAKIKVKVSTVDNYGVKSVKFNSGASVTANADGEYLSTSAFSSNVHIDVVLKTVTPPWGVRVETY